MRENISIISTRIIQIGLVLLAFLTPIFFLPTTSEFYNFNKTTLLIVMSAFLFLMWGIKMVSEGRVRMTRTPLDVPLLIFLGVYTLSTIFSIDPVTSLLGWHPVFFGSLPSIIALVVLYFIATTHLNATWRFAVLVALVASSSILGLVSVAQYFGHPVLSSTWAQARFWNPAGDLNRAVSYLAISVPLSLSLALAAKNSTLKYVFYVLAGIQIIALALINNLFGTVTLVAAFLFFLIFIPRIKMQQEDRTILGVLGILLVFFIVAVNTPLGKGVLEPLIAGQDKSLNVRKPVTLPISAGWQTSAQALTGRPVFGSGPSTFGMSYPSFKPFAINRINENNVWNVRFDEAGSAVLNTLGTAGALGVVAFLLIIFVLVRSLLTFSTKSEVAKASPSFILMQASLIAFVVGLFFFDLTAITAVAFVMVTASIFSTIRDLGSNLSHEVDMKIVALKKGAMSFTPVEGAATAPEGNVARNPNENPLTWTFLVPAVLLFAAAIFYGWRTYAAEFFYQRAIVASQEGKGNDTIQNLGAAIRSNPYRDTYYRALLATDLALARALNQKGNKMTDQERQTLLALVSQAIDQGRIITGYEGRGLGSYQIKRVPGSSPLNVANWESIATVYANLGGEVRENSAVHAINAFSQAIVLDRLNPRLHEALGNVYFNLGDIDNAKKNYERAIEAKFDYASAHYNLAQVYKRQGNNPVGVANELDLTLQLLKQNPEQNKDAIARIEKEFADAKKKAEEAIKKAQKNQKTASPSANLNR